MGCGCLFVAWRLLLQLMWHSTVGGASGPERTHPMFAAWRPLLQVGLWWGRGLETAPTLLCV